MIVKEAFKKLQAELPAAERIERVCVYGGASEGNWDGYVDAARRLGEVIGQAGLDVVYGGGRTGMMGAMADGALSKDAHVIGVIPNFLDKVEVGHRDVTDLRLVPDMHTRKRMMFDLAQAIVAMPGGFGTMEEIFEVITWKQLGRHNKPIIFFDTDQGFWQPMMKLIDHLEDQGFLHSRLKNLYTSIRHPEELAEAFERQLSD
ncbi:MAG: TIGR00730 family Rossman fold protein [Alphaproteobacteria bacterium]